MITIDRAGRHSARPRSTVVALVALVCTTGLVYGPALAGLWREWISNPDYSHGLIVAPTAAWLAWRRRDELRRQPMRPAWTGAVVATLSLVLFAMGTLAAELFTTRVSLIGVLVGTVAYTAGWRHVRVAAFPIAFLLFMIPLPAILFDRVTASLQLVASGLGESLLQLADVPVLRDGNVLTMSAVSLNVTEACSGIRSLMSLLALTSLVAYVIEPTRVRQVVLTLSAVPLAIVLNGMRVAVTGVAAASIGPSVARGTPHELTGWLVFVAAACSIWLIHRAVDWLGTRRSTRSAMEAA